MSILSGHWTIGKDINKTSYDEMENVEGIVSDALEELELKMSDEELIDLKKNWTKAWEPYNTQIRKLQDEVEQYWLGDQFNATQDKRPLVDNLIFESLETFLPMATRPKADPIVESDNTDEGNALAQKVRQMLIYVGDILSFNLKMKQVARFWALYYLGVMKVGWSERENDIACKVIRPQKLILDPKATIEEGEYTGSYIGEYMDDIAGDLVERFPKSKEYIDEMVKGKMGTSIQYIQWCTNEYMFWTLKDHVLGKIKNPHWNYDSTQTQMGMNNFGELEEQEVDVPGKNHFNNPKMPYIFLSIFNLGKQPHDETNLIHQNLGLQDLINKRLAQIDKNADNTNSGIIVSGDSFTEEQAHKVARARRKGGVVWVPTGDVNAAVSDIPARPLPNFIYESLLDYRTEIRNIFGTRGSSPQGTIREQTVGGKQIIAGQDADRIGGGISTFLEQFSDKVYNWFVQLMYVHYDEPHMASVMGEERTREYIQLSNQEMNRKLLVGVKEGSMVPQDPVAKRGEALELWNMQAIDPITLFDRLEFPNPRESAKNLYLWQADPVALFPDLQQQQQEQMMMEQAREQQMMAQEQEQEAILQQQQQAIEHENELERIAFQNAQQQV